ncbi:MAG: TolC family protein, partial [Gallionella sp.]
MLLRLTQAFTLLLLSGVVYASESAASTPPNALTLTQAEQLLQLHNRELQVAQSLYAGAQADTHSAAQRPNPNVSFNSSSIGPANGIGRGPMWNKSFDSIARIDQLFERGDKRALRGASAQFLADAAQHDVAEVQRQQRYLLRAAYYDLTLAQHKKLILEQSSALFDNAQQAAQLRLTAGDIAPSEVARLRVDAGRAANDAQTAAAELMRAQFNLAYLIGAENNAAQLVAIDSWANVQALPTANAAIEQRADVQAAQQRVYAAEKMLESARALQTRDVTLGLQYERYPGQPTNNGWGIGISMPLQINNTYQGESRRAQALGE